MDERIGKLYKMLDDAIALMHELEDESKGETSAAFWDAIESTLTARMKLRRAYMRMKKEDNHE